MLDKLFKSLNPSKVIAGWLEELGTGIVLTSYWICLIGALIGLILYVFGYQKGKNYPLISMGLYLIIRILGAVILGAK